MSISLRSLDEWKGRMIEFFLVNPQGSNFPKHAQFRLVIDM